MANPKVKAQLASVFDQAQLSLESLEKAEAWCKKNRVEDLLEIRADQVSLTNMLADSGLDLSERARFSNSFKQYSQQYPEEVGIEKLAEDAVKHTGGVALGTATGTIAAVTAFGGTAASGASVGAVTALATGSLPLASAVGGAFFVASPVVATAVGTVAAAKTFQWATCDSRMDFGSSLPWHYCAACGKHVHNRGCPSCKARFCKVCYEKHYCSAAEAGGPATSMAIQ